MRVLFVPARVRSARIAFRETLGDIRMKSMTRRIASIGLDVICLAVGFAATLLAGWADYEGTLSDFWLYRLGLGTTLVLLAGVVSSVLPGEGAAHRWVRFALFELLTIQWLVDFVVRHGEGPTSFHTTVQPLLVDCAAYWVGVYIKHLFVRAPGPNGVSR